MSLLVFLFVYPSVFCFHRGSCKEHIKPVEMFMKRDGKGLVEKETWGFGISTTIVRLQTLEGHEASRGKEAGWMRAPAWSTGRAQRDS